MTLGLVLDGIILLLLAGTIFFAGRLSLHLRDFRSNRAGMEKLVATLAEQITQAERAIAGMREAAREGGRDLQERINEARALTEELQFMNETGNNLAGRLEKAATSGERPSVPAIRGGERDATVVPPRSGFSIRDPDHGADDDDLSFDGDDDDTGLQSRAERELFAALQGGGNKGRR